MAIACELNQSEWDKWVNSRPESIKAMCRQYPPDRLYRLSPSGSRVTIHSYNENDTVTVTVSARYNLIAFERDVFGVDPEDLTECDLPTKDEKCGIFLCSELDAL